MNIAAKTTTPMQRRPQGDGRRPLPRLPARPRRVILTSLLLLSAAGWASSPASAQSCQPSTTPCQTCPRPTSCGTPPPGCFGNNPSGGTTTFTTTELSCTGSLDQTTIVVEPIIGGQGGGETVICIGPGGTQPARICPGNQNVNTVIHTITTSPANIPTLSVWGLALVGGGLCIAAIRRLRRRQLAGIT
jgi:hypothetical protein